MRFAFCLIVACVLVGGCKSNEKLLPPRVLQTPLPLDPTEQYELSTWWSNGAQLLLLEKTGGYALFGDANHYHAPIERGTWDQQSYATIWLRPYTSIERRPTRVTVSKIDGKIALNVFGAKPMFGMNEPPQVMEDKLLGWWSGTNGTLLLNSQLRYTFTPAGSGSNRTTPASMAGHSGSWKVEGDTIALAPDSPSNKAVTLGIKQEGGKITLESPQGTMTREAK